MEIMGTDEITTVCLSEISYLQMCGAQNVAGIPNILVKPIHPKEEIQIVLKRYLGEDCAAFLYKKQDILGEKIG